jgi:hypothetical protein
MTGKKKTSTLHEIKPSSQEPKKQDPDNGEQRDLMEEVLKHWQAFQNKQNPSSYT